MGKRVWVIIPALIPVVMILMEDLSWRALLVAFVISTVAVLFTSHFLPRQSLAGVSFLRLVTFPFYLIGQIYVAGFQVIKVVLKGPKVDIVRVKTKITAELLRVVLVDSITLTPGSILLDLDGEDVTLLWLHDKDSGTGEAVADARLKHKLERRLLKAQKTERDAV